MLTNKTVLVTGGTGSLGKTLVRRLLSEELGKPKRIVVFSRDEAKQHAMRLEFSRVKVATDEIIYHNFEHLLQFQIGDVRDFHSISSALRTADVVFNAAALKQVPACEYFPYEAVQTNIMGAQNIILAIREHDLPVEKVIGISTDKACKPVNTMGMTKALQEKIFTSASLYCPQTQFACVRYGNVLASRGSVIPLFLEQIENGGPVTITTPEMTRFLMSINQAVDTVFEAYKHAKPGETYIPIMPSARITDLAEVLIGNRPIKTKVVGVRPGEKIHEILISEEEGFRAVVRGKYYVILPILPELRDSTPIKQLLKKEFSSQEVTLDRKSLHALLSEFGLLDPHKVKNTPELLV